MRGVSRKRRMEGEAVPSRRPTAVAPFTETLGIPWIGSCPGHAGRKHAADEYLPLATCADAIEFIRRLIWPLTEGDKSR